MGVNKLVYFVVKYAIAQEKDYPSPLLYQIEKRHCYFAQTLGGKNRALSVWTMIHFWKYAVPESYQYFWAYPLCALAVMIVLMVNRGFLAGIQAAYQVKSVFGGKQRWEQENKILRQQYGVLSGAQIRLTMSIKEIQFKI